jgi:hypothetical protein
VLLTAIVLPGLAGAAARNPGMSDGPEAVRLRAVCQGEDETTWEVPVPVELSVSAKRIIGPGREPSA